MTTKEAIRDAVTLVLEGKDIKEAYLLARMRVGTNCLVAMSIFASYAVKA